jgi:hypothetical protein
MRRRHRCPRVAFLRSVALVLMLLVGFGFVRPAIGEEVTPPAQPFVASRARAVAQAWVPYGQPAPSGAYTTAATPPTPPEPKPVYAHASFWISLGLALAAGVVVGVVYERRHHELDMPTTTFGAKQF